MPITPLSEVLFFLDPYIKVINLHSANYFQIFRCFCGFSNSTGKTNQIPLCQTLKHIDNNFNFFPQRTEICFEFLESAFGSCIWFCLIVIKILTASRNVKRACARGLDNLSSTYLFCLSKPFHNYVPYPELTNMF